MIRPACVMATLSMKIVLQYAAGPMLADRLADLASGGLNVSVCPELESPRFEAVLADAEVVWHLLDPITAATMAAAPRLRLIQKIGVGVNTIDLEAAQRRGVAVCNMPGTNSQAVAEMTLLLMLGALRRVAHLDSATRAGRGWALPAALQDSYGELHGRTVGLVGYGAVPRCLAPMLVAIGARVLFCSRRPKRDAVGEPRVLPALLAESDIVSLHLPLTPETDAVIDAAAIASMKPGSVTALVTALRSGRLRAAGLDVFQTEPPGSGSPLLALDNVVVSPHVAWLTQETWARSLSVAVENCRRLGAGEDLLHRVM